MYSAEKVKTRIGHSGDFFGGEDESCRGEKGFCAVSACVAKLVGRWACAQLVRGQVFAPGAVRVSAAPSRRGVLQKGGVGGRGCLGLCDE
jgi:hypothetical protein